MTVCCCGMSFAMRTVVRRSSPSILSLSRLVPTFLLLLEGSMGLGSFVYSYRIRGILCHINSINLTVRSVRPVRFGSVELRFFFREKCFCKSRSTKTRYETRKCCFNIVVCVKK